MGKKNWWDWFINAVEALGEIGTQVGKKDWNFSVDPCTSNDSSWATPKSDLRPLYNNSLICNCSFPAGVCHVVKLYVPFHFISLIPSMIQLCWNYE
jgi:hypothetical protein